LKSRLIEIEKNKIICFFRLREGLKRPLLRNFNRPVMERENIKLLETVSKDLRNLINDIS